MSIVPSTGMINWQTPNNLTSPISFSVIVSNDKGDSVHQQVSFAVCSAPQHWDQYANSCLGGPVIFTSTPSIYGITAGEAYTYTDTATHADNLPLSYSLNNSPDGMTIDASSGLINWVAQSSVSGPVDFTVIASDGKGGTAFQTWQVLVCAAPMHWSAESFQCKGPIEFTSTPVYGLDEGQTFSYQVTATHDNGLPLTYSLGDIDPSLPRPAGMSIDAKTGLVSWIAQAQPIETTGGYAWFSVIATDSNGYSEPQTLQVLVCAAPSNWSDMLGGCRGAVRITSAQPVYGLDVGQTFTYQVVATEANPEGLPLTYSFSWIQPDSTGLSIDANTGLINWVATEDPNNPGVEAQVQFTITATDTLGQQESQNGYVSVCVAPLHWSPDNQVCQ